MLAHRRGKSQSNTPRDSSREPLVQHRGDRDRPCEPWEREKRKKAGLCPECGLVVTHQKWLLNAVKLPLTIPGTVYKGMCLECNSGTNAKLLLNERLSRAAGYAPSIFSPRDHGGEIKGVPTEDTTEISSLTADFSNVMLTNAGALNEAEEDHLRAGDQLGIMLPQCPMNVGSLEKTRGVGMDLDLDGLESMDHGFASAEIDSIFRNDSISMDSSKTVFDPKKYRDAEEAKRARRLRRGAC